MSTWTKQNLFELGPVTRDKSKHHPHPHPAASRSQLCYGVSHLVCIATVLQIGYYLDE